MLFSGGHQITLQGPYYLTSFDGTTETFRALTSSDAVNYTDLSVVYSPPGPYNTVRDPYPIIRNNQYIMAHTVANLSHIGSQNTTVAIAASQDGIHWTCIATPDFSGSISGLFTLWCAGWYQEGPTDYLVLIGSTHNPFDDGGFQAYLTSPVTPGNYTAWNAAQLLTVTGESNILASNIVKSGGNYFLWYKTETPDGGGKVWVQVAKSTTGINGTYTNIQTGDWLGTGGGYEGSLTALLINGTTWQLNTDQFTGTGLHYLRQLTGDWTTGASTWSAPASVSAAGSQLRNGGWMISMPPQF